MAEPGAPGVLCIMGRRWDRRSSETAFVLRALAGAASRQRPVRVLCPGAPGPARPDGAFDVRPVGAGLDPGTWPSPGQASWPAGPGPSIVLVEPGDRAALAVARTAAPDAVVLELVASIGGPDAEATEADAGLAVTSWAARAAHARGLDPAAVFEVGLHVPVNGLAAEHRHNGIGVEDYLLVLSDRAGAETTPVAAWLAARFPRETVVVVQDAVASVFLGRALRGRIAVDTRTDLWRFMAHARVTVDLRPGRLVARECVESLRFATPVVVPVGTVGAEHAEAGGGRTYRSLVELFDQLADLADPRRRADLARSGRAVADERYGDAGAFTARVAAALSRVDELTRDRRR